MSAPAGDDAAKPATACSAVMMLATTACVEAVTPPSAGSPAAMPALEGDEAAMPATACSAVMMPATTACVEAATPQIAGSAAIMMMAMTAGDVAAAAAWLLHLLPSLPHP